MHKLPISSVPLSKMSSICNYHEKEILEVEGILGIVGGTVAGYEELYIHIFVYTYFCHCCLSMFNDLSGKKKKSTGLCNKQFDCFGPHTWLNQVLIAWL